LISTIQPAAPALAAPPPQAVQTPESNARPEDATTTGGISLPGGEQAASGQRVEGVGRGAEIGEAPERSGQVGQEESDPAKTDANELTEEEQRELEKLKARDREVRAHEQAHLVAAGSLARGGPTYTYERGPDQQLYAVGGQVQIDTSEVPGDPEATIAKAQIIRRAALAPAQPSSQDRAVAADAAQMAAEARMELAAEKSGLSEQSGEEPAPASELASEEARATSPACGGAHSADAHDGMTAYAAQNTTAPQPSLVTSV
jgi:hypothetical protein